MSHGGNNSVTEALTAGVPLLVLPLSTDQFAGAAAVERGGVGLCLDPNAATPDDIRAAVQALLSPTAPAQPRPSWAPTCGRFPGARRAHAAVSAAWPLVAERPEPLRG